MAKYENLLLTEKRYMEGRVIGQTSYEKGRQETIQRKLEIKFGSLSERAVTRLKSLSSDQLLNIEKLLFQDKSLRDMGLEEGGTDE